MDNKKGFRNFQLLCMAFVSVFIGPVVMFVTMVVYGLPFPTSISETATIANQTAMILPFALGALALFALSYSIRYAYNDKLDRIFTACMAGGFTLVAFQPCVSPYLIQEHVGVFGLTHTFTNITHYTGALVGFAGFILWILLCFTKSDKPKDQQTSEKRLRNNIYMVLAQAMLLSLILVPMNLIGLFGDNFPITMWLEVCILTFGGIACGIKSGLVLKDKKG